MKFIFMIYWSSLLLFYTNTYTICILSHTMDELFSLPFFLFEVYCVNFFSFFLLSVLFERIGMWTLSKYSVNISSLVYIYLGLCRKNGVKYTKYSHYITIHITKYNIKYILRIGNAERWLLVHRKFITYNRNDARR